MRRSIYEVAVGRKERFVGFVLVFGRRFIAYLLIVVAIGGVMAALVALLTAQPAGASSLPAHPMAQAASENEVPAPVELAFTGTDDLTLSLLGLALVVGGGVLLVTAKQVDQRKR